MPSAPPTRAGDLVRESPARLLLELHEERATGALYLRRAQMKRVAYFLDGDAVYADSNLRGETLGQFLVDRAVLTHEQVDQALELAQLRRIRLGEALVHLEFLNEQGAFEQLTAQVQMKIANALRWRQGDYEFHAGDAFSGKVVRCTIDLPRLVFKVLPRLPSPGVPRVTVRPTTRFGRYRDTLRALYGPTLLEKLESGPLSTVALLEHMRDSTLLGQLRALWETGLIDVADEATRAPGAPVVELGWGDPGRDDLQEELSRDAPARHPSGLTPAVPREDPAEFTPKERAARKLILGAYLSSVGKRPGDILGVAKDPSADEIEAAFRQQSERFDPSRFEGLNLGPERAKLDELRAAIRQAYESLKAPPLAGRPEGTRTTAQRAMQAELLFREGEQILREGDAARAEPYFRTALAMSPEHADYHAHLGWTRYLAAGGDAAGATAAAAHIEEALALDPDLPAAREFAARVALETGAPTAAAAHLERLLEVQPEHERVVEWLEAACAQRGAPREMERLYRKALTLLTDRDARRSAEILLKLARGYVAVGEFRNAHVALEAAARRAPEDSRVRDAIAALPPPSGAAPAALDAVTIARRFRENVAAGRAVAALQHAAALVARGAADDEARAYYARNRPRLLGRRHGPLDADALARVRHADDRADLERRLGDAAAAIRAAEPVPPPAGAEAADLPPLFASVLAHVARQLGVDPPAVRVLPDAGVGVRLVDAAPLLLVVTRGAIESTDKLRLACAFARDLYMAGGGRALVAGRGPAQIKPYVGGEAFDLDRYVAGVRRTAERLALLLCGDLAVSLDVVGGDSAARDALEAFALAESFPALREELGFGEA